MTKNIFTAIIAGTALLFGSTAAIAAPDQAPKPQAERVHQQAKKAPAKRAKAAEKRKAQTTQHKRNAKQTQSYKKAPQKAPAEHSQHR